MTTKRWIIGGIAAFFLILVLAIAASPGEEEQHDYDWDWQATVAASTPRPPTPRTVPLFVDASDGYGSTWPAKRCDGGGTSSSAGRSATTWFS